MIKVEYNSRITAAGLEPDDHELCFTPPKIPQIKDNHPSSLNEIEPDQCNGEICHLIKRFYESPKDAKWEITKILKEVKNLNSKEAANFAFTSVYKNIKAYIKGKRYSLYQKLGQLRLILPNEKGKSEQGNVCLNEYQRSSEDGDSMMAIINLVPVSENPMGYIEFFCSLCEKYKDICEVTNTGIEEICEEILLKCHVNPLTDKCNIHKTLFYDHIIRDHKISVHPLLLIGSYYTIKRV